MLEHREVSCLNFYRSIDYSDKQLKEIIGSTSKNNLSVAIINHKLERDYYERSIGDNCYVLSLFETGDIILKNDFKIWQFIIQELYYFSAVFYRTKGDIPLSDDAFTHQTIRKCLFDFNDDKNDIVYSLGDVSICSDCETKFDKTFVPKDFVQNIKRELKRIKKGIFYRTRDFIRQKPIISLFIGIFLAIVIGITSNFIFYLISKLFCFE